MLATELILQKIQQLDGLKNTVIISRDGLILDSYFSEEIDKEFISAIILNMFNQVEKQSSRFNKKDIELITIDTDEANIFITLLKLSDEPFVIYTEFKTDIDILQTTELFKEAINSFL